VRIGLISWRNGTSMKEISVFSIKTDLALGN
jgi:hypothetical protein